MYAGSLAAGIRVRIGGPAWAHFRRATDIYRYGGGSCQGCLGDWYERTYIYNRPAWQWQYVTITHDQGDQTGNNDKFYINGVGGALPSQTKKTCGGSAANINIGQLLTGDIDDLRLSNRVLTPVEVLKLYQTSVYQQVIIPPP